MGPFQSIVWLSTEQQDLGLYWHILLVSCYFVVFYHLYSDCPKGFEENAQTCYKHVTDLATGDGAQTACVAAGSNLVTVDDAKENDRIKAILR